MKTRDIENIYNFSFIALGPKLLQYLREVIPQPKSRSERWVSTSVPQMLWKDPRATLSSAEYHTNNLLVSFKKRSSFAS